MITNAKCDFDLKFKVVNCGSFYPKPIYKYNIKKHIYVKEYVTEYLISKSMINIFN